MSVAYETFAVAVAGGDLCVGRWGSGPRVVLGVHGLTRTHVEQVSISSFELTRSGADFEATGAGTALVNGVSTSIEFTATQTGSDVTFEVRDDADTLLIGTDGEVDRAAFQLTVTP